jgi:tetratricopeptide (TPR) repeat protein
VSTGLDVEDALRRAVAFRRVLRGGKAASAEFQIDAESAEVLHALCAVLSQSREAPDVLLNDGGSAFEFISGLVWPTGQFGGREELLSQLAFVCWRNARRSGKPSAEQNWLKRYDSTLGPMSATRLAAVRILATPISERTEELAGLHLDDPETLLSVLAILRAQWDAGPAKALEEAAFLYRYLESIEVRHPVDPILCGEREHFLGESARIAGTAARFLSRRDEARRWFDLAESWFLATENAGSNLARLSYQRLALRTEERDFEAVPELLPHLIANFERMAMAEDALKSRFLEAEILKETGQLVEATKAYGRIIEQAKALRNEPLLASAYVNVVQVHAFLGDFGTATACAQEAASLLKRLSNRVALAKLQWGLGHLFRQQGKLVASVEAFREAQKEFSEIEMHADVAAVHLILGDLLLDAGQPAQAEWEIQAALPVIDEYKLVPERIAALSLLRESLKRRQIDRAALRNLHGYFREP